MTSKISPDFLLGIPGLELEGGRATIGRHDNFDSIGDPWYVYRFSSSSKTGGYYFYNPEHRLSTTANLWEVDSHVIRQLDAACSSTLPPLVEAFCFPASLLPRPMEFDVAQNVSEELGLYWMTFDHGQRIANRGGNAVYREWVRCAVDGHFKRSRLGMAWAEALLKHAQRDQIFFAQSPYTFKTPECEALLRLLQPGLVNLHSYWRPDQFPSDSQSVISRVFELYTEVPEPVRFPKLRDVTPVSGFWVLVYTIPLFGIPFRYHKKMETVCSMSDFRLESAWLQYLGGLKAEWTLTSIVAALLSITGSCFLALSEVSQKSPVTARYFPVEHTNAMIATQSWRDPMLAQVVRVASMLSLSLNLGSVLAGIIQYIRHIELEGAFLPKIHDYFDRDLAWVSLTSSLPFVMLVWAILTLGIGLMAWAMLQFTREALFFVTLCLLAAPFGWRYIRERLA